MCKYRLSRALKIKLGETLKRRLKMKQQQGSGYHRKMVDCEASAPGEYQNTDDS